MRRKKLRFVTFQTDRSQVEALRRAASRREHGRHGVSEVIRDAIAGYLAAHEPAGPRAARMAGENPVPWRAGRGKGPPRIMLHLRDTERLRLLQLQTRTLKGTHRTVGRVIRAAIDEYLAAHAPEREELLKRKREELGDRLFSAWKRKALRDSEPHDVTLT